MQAYDAFEKVERALGVDPENPIIPVFLVVGGTFYLGYAQLNLCIPHVAFPHQFRLRLSWV